MSDEKVRDSSANFSCNICEYTTCRKSQYDRHIATLKHKKMENTAKIQQNTANMGPIECSCGRVYKHRGSLYNHKKKCDYDDKTTEPKYEPNYTELIMKLINENQELRNTVILENKELRNQITELIPKVGNNTINNKQKFNINVFLNEKCKDAVTMEQFMNNLEVSLSNLMVTKNKGIDEGISNIFIENMNKLSLYERPIHCTDIKRETVYIKSDGGNGKSPKWEKDEENEKLKKVIKNVAHTQQKNLTKWVERHPNWQANSELQDEYMKLVRSCTDDIKENKVIKKICSKGEPSKG
jgi:hypothetical protein